MSLRKALTIAAAATAALGVGAALVACGREETQADRSWGAPAPTATPSRPRDPGSADPHAADEAKTPPREYVVVDSESDQPIAGARLVLREDGRDGDLAEATTDAAGRARFDRTRPSILVVQATAPGYRPALDRFSGEESSKPVKLWLSRGIPAAGRVLDDATGAPIAGARILSVSLSWREGFTGMSSAPSSPQLEGEFRTDAAGRFDIPGVPTRGWVTVWVLARGYLPTDEVREADGADALEFGDIRVERGTPLRLRVLRPDDTPAEGAFVSTPLPPSFGAGGGRWSDGIRFSARADSDGRVTFPHAAPGAPYSFSAFTADRSLQCEDAAVIAPGDAQDTEAVLCLAARDASVEVRITGADGASIDDFAWVSVHSAGIDDSAASGPYVFERLPRGPCTIHVAARDQPTWRGEVVLDASKRPVVEVKLGGTERIAGRVVDEHGAPVVGAIAQLADAAPSECPDFFRRAETDAAGAFAFEGLPARQTYAILVQADEWMKSRVECRSGTADVVIPLTHYAALTARLLHPADAPPPELATIDVDGENGHHVAFVSAGRLGFRYLRPGKSRVVLSWHGVVPRALDVDATPGAEIDLGDVKFERARVARGVLLDADGAPVADARVTVEGPGTTCWGDTDDAGRFEVEGLDAGPYRAHVWRGTQGYCGRTEFSDRSETRIALTCAQLVRIDSRGNRPAAAGSRVAVVPAHDPSARDEGWSLSAGDDAFDYRGVFKAWVLPGRWIAIVRGKDGAELGRVAFDVERAQPEELRLQVDLR